MVVAVLAQADVTVNTESTIIGAWVEFIDGVTDNIGKTIEQDRADIESKCDIPVAMTSVYILSREISHSSVTGIVVAHACFQKAE